MLFDCLSVIINGFCYVNNLNKKYAVNVNLLCYIYFETYIDDEIEIIKNIASLFIEYVITR